MSKEALASQKSHEGRGDRGDFLVAPVPAIGGIWTGYGRHIVIKMTSKEALTSQKAHEGRGLRGDLSSIQVHCLESRWNPNV